MQDCHFKSLKNNYHVIDKLESHNVACYDFVNVFEVETYSREAGKMKVKITLLIFMLLFITATLYANPVQNFSFVDINGKIHNWEDLKGIPLVVNIGSHW